MNACEHPPDVTLLLRAHAEQRWLSREVLPVVRQLETGAPARGAAPRRARVPGGDVGRGGGRAREADATLRRLDALGTGDAARRPLPRLGAGAARGPSPGGSRLAHVPPAWSYAVSADATRGLRPPTAEQRLVGTR